MQRARDSAEVERVRQPGAVRSRAQIVSALHTVPYKSRKDGERTILDLALMRLGALVDRGDAVSVRYAIDQAIGSPKAIITTEIDSPAVLRAACLLVYEMFGPDRVEQYTMELIRRVGEETSLGGATNLADLLRPVAIDADVPG